MKEIMGLVVFLSFGAIVLYLGVTRMINATFTVFLLLVFLGAGFVIANYDVINFRIKGLGVELEAFKKEIAVVKEQAVAELQAELAKQRESVTLLIANANDTRERIEEEKEKLETLTAQSLQTKERIEALNEASSELALLLSKITWLQTVTKSEFGTERSRIATEQMLEDLDRLLVIIIPNAQEREEWIRQLTESLPPRE